MNEESNMRLQRDAAKRRAPEACRWPLENMKTLSISIAFVALLAAAGCTTLSKPESPLNDIVLGGLDYSKEPASAVARDILWRIQTAEGRSSISEITFVDERDGSTPVTLLVQEPEPAETVLNIIAAITDCQMTVRGNSVLFSPQYERIDRPDLSAEENVVARSVARERPPYPKETVVAAERLLRYAQEVGVGGHGFSGEILVENYAIFIMAHQPDPVPVLRRVLAKASPAGRVYILSALSQFGHSMSEDRSQFIRDTKYSIMRFDGCEVSYLAPQEAWSVLIAEGTLFREVDEFITSRTERTEANKMPGHVP